MALSHEQFDALMDEALIAFNAKQDHLDKTYGLSAASRWVFSDKTQKLHLMDAADQPYFEADAIEIGMFNTNASGWLWAWANPGVSPAARARSERLKELAEVTGYEVFETGRGMRLPDLAMAWRLTAMAVRHLDAMGAYRLPSADGVFMGFVAVMTARDLRGPGGFNSWTRT